MTRDSFVKMYCHMWQPWFDDLRLTYATADMHCRACEHLVQAVVKLPFVVAKDLLYC
jgi:hypothetical protein